MVAALALKRGFPAAAARVDAARGHRRYCGAVATHAQHTIAVHPRFAAKTTARSSSFKAERSGFCVHSIAFVCSLSIRKGRLRTTDPPAGKKRQRLSHPAHRLANRFIPRHSHSFVTTSAQNFVKGPLRVAFKSTNNRVQRRPRHHELFAVATGLQPVVMHEECSRQREAPAVLPHTRAHLPRSGTHAPKHTAKSAPNDTPAGTRWPSRSSRSRRPAP